MTVRQKTRRKNAHKSQGKEEGEDPGAYVRLVIDLMGEAYVFGISWQHTLSRSGRLAELSPVGILWPEVFLTAEMTHLPR